MIVTLPGRYLYCCWYMRQGFIFSDVTPKMGRAMRKTYLREGADSEGSDQPAQSAQADQGFHCPLTEPLDTALFRLTRLKLYHNYG